MRVYRNITVLEAARQRIAWLYDEFETVIVSFSGGKDSTVVLNLTLEEAERRGRLPVPVIFIDQEAEWQMVIDYAREVREDPRVDFMWFQVPFRIFNACSADHEWLHAWDPAAEAEWVRPREPGAITENVYGTDRFGDLFDRIPAHHWKGPLANIGGVRCSESPGRRKGLTSFATYKHVTWGSKTGRKARGQFDFYPIFDWEDSDVWKAIHAHGWRYCRVYDEMYRYGCPLKAMRVSNLSHETALSSLLLVQEVERETWNRVQQRLPGANTLRHLRADFHGPRELPPMFADWTEYRDFLLERLITNAEHREKMRRSFASLDASYHEDVLPSLIRMQISAILVNDYHMTKLGNFIAANSRFSKGAGKNGGSAGGGAFAASLAKIDAENGRKTA